MATNEFLRFAHLLRRTRVAAGLTQEALAERSGVSIRAISDLERGVKHTPRRDTARLLAEALGLSAEESAAFQAVAGVTRLRGDLPPAPASGSPAMGATDEITGQTTAELARRLLPDGVGLRGLGVHELKRLERPEETFQVLHPNLFAAFPPQLSAQAPKTNLPAALTSFIGRVGEQHQIRHLLAGSAGEEGCRLLTLVGAVGCGKTRLALAAAEALVGEYADGVWLVELAATAGPELVPWAVAQALGLRESAIGGVDLGDPEGGPREALVQFLRERHLLLVLDNCEHLIGACAALVGTLLRRCPRLGVLATSRESLEVSGERIYRVPSLALPDSTALPPVEQLLTYEAVRLFVARARARRASFALTAENAAAVRQVCCRLDGIPLAIELAAARIGSLPVASIAARLDNCFQLLTGGPRTVLPRQQTLRAAVDWSYDLLDARERALFRRLSVFAGGWLLEAAASVCVDALPSDVAPAAGGIVLRDDEVLDVLDALVNKSLVQLEDQPEQHDHARYRLLGTLQEYARERLIESGEAERVQRRHAREYLALAEEAQQELTRQDQAVWLAHLEREHDNLRAALGWARRQEDLVIGLRLTAALWRFWYLRGYLSEGRAMLEDILAAFTIGESDAAAPWAATAYHGASVLAWTQGDYARAVLLAEQGLALRRADQDRSGIAFSLNVLGLVAIDQGDLGRAATLLEECLALRRQLGETWGIAMCLNNLGIVARHQGDYTRSGPLHAESLALQRALGDDAGMAISLYNLGMVACGQGAYEQGTTLFHQSLTLGRTVGDKVVMAQCLEGIAGVAQSLGHPGRAVQLLGAASSIREGLGAPIARAERVAHSQIIAALRESLASEFAPTWAAGRALPLEEAVQLAFSP